MWVLLGGLLLTAGDVVIKYWIANAEHPGMLFGAGYALYLIGVLCMIMSFFGQNIALATMAAILVNVISLTLVSSWIFNESVSVLGYLGLGIAFVALGLIEFYA